MPETGTASFLGFLDANPGTVDGVTTAPPIPPASLPTEKSSGFFDGLGTVFTGFLGTTANALGQGLGQGFRNAADRIERQTHEAVNPKPAGVMATMAGSPWAMIALIGLGVLAIVAFVRR